MNEIDKYNKNIFESIKHIDEEGNEYWYARELQKVLGYKRWEKFLILLEKAKEACINSNFNMLDHFPHLGKMVEIGSKTKEK